MSDIQESFNSYYEPGERAGIVLNKKMTLPKVAKTGIAGAGALATAFLNSEINQQTSGQLSQNVGLMNPVVEPYLIIRHKNYYNPDDSNIASTRGLPSNAYVSLGSVHGVTKVLECHLEIPSATQDELNEIESLLKGGVIL